MDIHYSKFLVPCPNAWCRALMLGAAPCLLLIGTTFILLMMLWFGNIRPSQYGSNHSPSPWDDSGWHGRSSSFLLFRAWLVKGFLWLEARWMGKKVLLAWSDEGQHTFCFIYMGRSLWILVPCYQLPGWRPNLYRPAYLPELWELTGLLGHLEHCYLPAYTQTFLCSIYSNLQPVVLTTLYILAHRPELRERFTGFQTNHLLLRNISGYGT